MNTHTIHLIRHAKTRGGAALNGITDVAVDASVLDAMAASIRQAGLPVDHVMTSPLVRCQALAAKLCSPNHPFQVMPAFQEMNFGEFDGRCFNDLNSAEWAVLERFWQAPADVILPGSEGLCAFHQRVVNGWLALTAQLKQDVTVVTHGGVIRMLIALVLDLDWRNPALFVKLAIANQSVTTIEVTDCEPPFYRVMSIGVPL